MLDTEQGSYALVPPASLSASQHFLRPRQLVVCKSFKYSLLFFNINLEMFTELFRGVNTVCLDVRS